MARHEQDREDLLREATALTVRAELANCGFTENVVIGFRSTGAASVFIGGDPVYQFNIGNELRRGFRDGRLIKAVGGRLFELRRERTDQQVRLLRRELDDADTQSYLAQCRSHLEILRDQLHAGQYEVIGQVPAEEKVVSRIVQWLDRLPSVIAVAPKPNVE